MKTTLRRLSSVIVYLCINNVNSRLLPSLDSLPPVTTETSQINTHNQYSRGCVSYNGYPSHLTSTWPTHLQVQVQIPTYFQYTCQFLISLKLCCKLSIVIQGLFQCHILSPSVPLFPIVITARNEVGGSVCQEFCLQWGDCLIACWDTPPEQTPPPRKRGRHTPPGANTPPPRHSACWEIRATSGRYASYWNAILLNVLFLLL